jgi:phospholipase/carboxylesterase
MSKNPWSRRRFVTTLSSVVAGGVTLGCMGSPSGLRTGTGPSRLTARPGTPSQSITPGTHPLNLGSTRDGLLHVPATYDPAKQAPFAILLHGAGHAGNEWQAGFSNLDSLGIVSIAPDSRGATWDIVYGRFGPDVEFIDAAMKFAFDRCNVDPKRLALAGFSDGASYALSLGLGNGDFLTHVMAFSPGFASPSETIGKPPVYVTHGRGDNILPIDKCSRPIVRSLRSQGYDVHFDEFDGGHSLPPEIGTRVFGWFANGS